MWYWKRILVGFVLLSIYTIFWFWFFEEPQEKENISNISFEKSQDFSSVQPENLAYSVLGDKISEPVLPSSYKIPIVLRKQFFNLSCEFAAGSGIIYHFTNNSDFAVKNQSEAEKTLIDKVAISNNPNVGVRMGTASFENLYHNLNRGFGGSEYYGIHAPPFIDIFNDYNLSAKPIYINDSTINSIQKAISSGHLIMAWIKIGYSKPIDDFLSYGKVKIVKGEHAVVIIGYDSSGVIIMDPGIGLERHIGYESLLDASSFFPVPFLDVSRGDEDRAITVQDLIIGFDQTTEIDRSRVKIYIQNGSRKAGSANQMRGILKDFGYNVVGIGNAGNFDYQDITIRVKKDFSDFLYILKRDIKIADFLIASASADLSDEEKEVIIIVGN